MPQNEPISSVPNIDWVQQYFVQSGGGGGSVTLPSSLGQYQQQRPLDRNLDFTTTPSYNVLVQDTPVVANSKVAVNSGVLNTTRQGIVNTQNIDRANRIAEDAKLDQKINAEIANRETADTNLQNSIDTEIEQRQSADQEIQGDISDLQQQINTINTNLSNKANQTALDAEVLARQNGDTALDTALDAEILQRQNDVLALQQQIDGLGIADLDSLDIGGMRRITGQQNFAWIPSLSNSDVVPVSVLTQAYNAMETNMTVQLDKYARLNQLDNALIGGDLKFCSDFDFDGTQLMTRNYIRQLPYITGDLDTSHHPLQSRQIFQNVYKKAETYNKLETDNLINLALDGLSYNQINNEDLSSSLKINNDGTATLKLDNYDNTFYQDPNTERLVVQPANGLIFNTNSISYLDANVQITDDAQLVTKKYVDQNTGGGTTDQTLVEIQTANPIQEDLDLGFNTIKTSKVAQDLNDVPNLNYLQLNYLDNTYTLDLIQPPAQNLDLNNKKIVNLADPTLAQDATTKAFVEANFLSTTTKLNDLQVDGNIDLDVNKIQTSAIATLPNDIPNYNQIQTEFADLQTPINLFGLPINSLDMNSKKIVNLATPQNDQDACTKAYADSLVGIAPTTQIFDNTYTGLSNFGVVTVTHNLGYTFNNLNIQWFVQFNANTDGWTTSDWINVSELDRSAGTLTRNLQFGALGTSTSQFQINLGGDGVNLLRKSDSVHNGYAWNLVKLRIIVTPNNGATKIVYQQTGINADVINWNADVTTAYQINTPVPVSSTNAVNKNYVDTTFYRLGTNLDMQSNFRIRNLANALVNGDAINKGQCDAFYLARAGTTLQSIQTLNPLTGDLTLNGVKITGVAQATTNSDVVIKSQLDSVQTTLQTNINNVVNNDSLIRSSFGNNYFECDNTRNYINGAVEASVGINQYFDFYPQTKPLPPVNSGEGLVQILDNITIGQGGQNRYSLNCLAFGSGRSAQFRGAVDITFDTNAGQDINSSLLFIYGKAQSYGWQSWNPSERRLKSYINESQRNFEGLQWKEFIYDPEVFKSLNIPVNIEGKLKYGFIIDELQELGLNEYIQDHKGILCIEQTELYQNICGWLLNERHKMRQELDDLKHKYESLEQRLAVLESK